MCSTTTNKRKRQDEVGTGALPASAPTASESKIRRIFMSSLPARMLKQLNHDDSPDKALTSLLTANHIPVQIRPFNSVECDGFFKAVTQDEIDAYQNDVVAAVRKQDLQQLRQLHAQGRILKCSNKYGESLLHLACRRGMVDVVDFLVNTAQVPMAVCDDYGRTPLSDACWTPEPNFELIDLILSVCPDLLYIQDKRGNTPLAYVRKENWGEWNHYLRGKSVSALAPRLVKLQ